MKIKELEDFPWFPPILRKYQMEMIGMIVSKLGLYRQVAPMVKSDMENLHLTHIQDLCSGSGFPAVYVHRHFGNEDYKTALSDKFPQSVIPTHGITYLQQSMDVLEFQPQKDTYYTMYNAFHHFDASEQEHLIKKMADNGCTLMIVEIVQPTLLNVLQITLASFFGVVFAFPFIRPFEWKRFFLTFILPLNMVTILIDGYISILKSRTVQGYKEDLMHLASPQVNIDIKEHFSFPSYIITIKIQGL